jgi:hypothetical protein
MITIRHRVALAAVVAAVPFAVLACSSSNKDGSGQHTSTGSTAATTAQSGSTSAAPPAAAGDGKLPNSCSLISPDDAKAALGEDVDPGGEVPLTGGGGTCTFGASTGEDNPDDVVVQIGPVDLIRQTVNGHKTQAVSGVGDEALLYGLGSDIYNIFVRSGSTGIDINLSKGMKLSDPEALPPQPVADTLTTLAKTALSHL